jgi:imidazolonepropionase-like amidohydrolase
VNLPRPAAALLLLATSVAGAAPPPAEDAPVAVRGARIFDGREWRGAGFVVLSGGKVTAVAAQAPAGSVVGGADAWITPGWIDAASSTGVVGGDAEMTREVTPCVRPLRAYDPASRGVRAALAAGVTSLFLTPGNGNVVGGVASVAKTLPAPDGATRVVKETAALKIAFGGEPSSGNFPARGIPFSIYARRPTTRMGVLAVLRDAWILGRDAGPDAADADLAAMARAARGEIPVRAGARHVEDLRTAIRAGADLGFKPVVEGAAEGYVAAKRVAAGTAGCVVGPLVYPASGRGVDGTEPALDNAALLRAAGVPVALTAAGDAALLRDQVALAVRYGLDPDDALRAVTSVAAELSGVADRVGSLAPGRDADVVVWDGDPREPATRVRAVLVDGRVAWKAPEEKR